MSDDVVSNPGAKLVGEIATAAMKVANSVPIIGGIILMFDANGGIHSIDGTMQLQPASVVGGLEALKQQHVSGMLDRTKNPTCATQGCPNPPNPPSGFCAKHAPVQLAKGPIK